MATDSELIEATLKLISEGKFAISDHALERMMQRTITVGDIQEAAAMATDADLEGPTKLKFTGPDLFGDLITVIADFSGGILIITVFGD